MVHDYPRDISVYIEELLRRMRMCKSRLFLPRFDSEGLGKKDFKYPPRCWGDIKWYEVNRK